MREKKLKIISFHLPVSVIKELERLIQEEKIPNRALFIRSAVYVLLSKLLSLENSNPTRKENLLKKIFVEDREFKRFILSVCRDELIKEIEKVRKRFNNPFKIDFSVLKSLKFFVYQCSKCGNVVAILNDLDKNISISPCCLESIKVSYVNLLHENEIFIQLLNYLEKLIKILRNKTLSENEQKLVNEVERFLIKIQS